MKIICYESLKLRRSEIKFRISNHAEITNIYGLINPNYPDHIRYIGKSDCLQERLKAHIDEAIYTKKITNKLNWIRSLLKDNLQPDIVLIDWVPQAEWELLEDQYIELFKAYGHRLTNNAKGGRGGYISKEAYLKIGEKMKIHHANNPGKFAKDKNPNYQNFWTDEQKKNLSVKKKGKNKGIESKIFNKIHINNGIIGKIISKDELIPVGWVRGQLKQRSLKNRIHIKKGDIGKLIYEEELDYYFKEGFVLGINFNAGISSIGRMWVNNGVEDRFVLKEDFDNLYFDLGYQKGKINTKNMGKGGLGKICINNGKIGKRVKEEHFIKCYSKIGFERGKLKK